MALNKRLALIVGLGVSTAYFAGCGGSGGGSSSSGGGGGTGGTTNGASSFSVTDASSDQIQTFQVDVTDISLTRPNGAVLHTLPATARVDFAELVNESQLLTSYGLLAGTYTQVSMTLDFSTANVIISGQTTPATLTDTNGNPLNGPLTLPVKLESGLPLIVAPGRHNLVSLDFDLDGSCAIDSASNTVQVGPVLKAEADPSNVKPHDVAGILASVNSATSTIGITINLPTHVAGPAFTINTTGTTIYFVEGSPFVGAAGLAAVAAMPAGTVVAAQGQISSTTPSMNAGFVEAWVPKDVVYGHVLSRDTAGNLTVRGSAIDFKDGTGEVASVLINETITVEAASAKVYERFNANVLDQNAIGVGARIIARGNFSGSTLDCSSGHVLLPETGVFGYTTGPTVGSTMTVQVARIGRRPISDFNFTVGTTVTADPNNYVINTSTLNVASLASGAPVAVRALIAPWNTTGTSNATAITVVDRSAFALLYCDWILATATPFGSSSSTQLTLDLAGTGHRFIDPGFISTTRFQATDTPAVVANPAGVGFFAVFQNGGITLWPDFASFEADVTSRIAGGAKAKAFSAIGAWNGTTTTLTDNRAAIFLR
jgi:hypothetical protein